MTVSRGETMVRDPAYALHEAHRLFGLPAFVKQASAIEPEELVALPASAFADPIRRRYPCHTKAASWLSNAEFWAGALFNPTAEPETAQQLLKMSRFWEIESDVRDVLSKAAADHETYSGEVPDAYFAVVGTWGGQRHRYLPITDAKSLKSAAEGLYASRHNLPFAVRKEAALRILNKAGDLGVTLDPSPEASVYLTQATLSGTPDLAKAAEAMTTRAVLLNRSRPEVAAALHKLAGKLTVATLEKAAHLVDAVDTETELQNDYRKGLALFEESAFGVAKAAQPFVRLQGGIELSLEQVKAAGLAAFRLIPEYTSAVCDAGGHFDAGLAADVLPTLPAPDARMYAEMVKAAEDDEAPAPKKKKIPLGPIALGAGALGAAGLWAASRGGKAAPAADKPRPGTPTFNDPNPRRAGVEPSLNDPNPQRVGAVQP